LTGALGPTGSTGSSDLPIGTIVSYYGSTGSIPNNWAICDGNNGTPNLSGLFIMGQGNTTYPYASTGGSGSITLTGAQLPAHSHTVLLQSSGNAGSGTTPGCPVAPSIGMGTFTTDNGPGASDPINILPPYYVLYYIMKIA
jgi:microcystin-dependent protein